MCRQRRHYLYRAKGTPKLFTIHYSLFTRKVKPCVPVAFIYKNLLALQICTVSICKTRRFIRYRIFLRQSHEV